MKLNLKRKKEEIEEKTAETEQMEESPEFRSCLNMVSGKKFRESVENQIYPLFPCQMFRLTEIFLSIYCYFCMYCIAVLY